MLESRNQLSLSERVYLQESSLTLTVAVRSNSLVVSLKMGAHAMYGWSMPVRGSLFRLTLLELLCPPFTVVEIVGAGICADMFGRLAVVWD